MPPLRCRPLLVVFPALLLPALGQVNWRNLNQRAAHAMAPDLTTGALVMFGGQTAATAGGLVELGDTWESDAGSHGWAQRNTAIAPAARRDHAMAPFLTTTDAIARVVLFGGRVGSGVVAAETFEWQGGSWRVLNPALSPAARFGHGMAFDINRQRIVLFGGRDNVIEQQDTWEWDGSNWSNIVVPAPRPSRRYGHGMVFDQNAGGGSGRILLFGGLPANDETWEYDGSAWTLRATTAPRAGLRDYAMVYDRTLGKVLLFGGRDGVGNPVNDTWVWERGTGAWQVLSPPAAPPGRYGHRLEYDAANGVVTLIGGLDAGGSPINDAWEWNGVTWRQPAAPSARFSSVMVYDTIRRQLVLFGGSPGTGAVGDTWVKGPAGWEQRQVPVAPSARQAMAAAFDARRGEMVLFSGTLAAADTWTWNGSVWTQKFPAQSPTARFLAKMAYDSIRDRIVLYGGVPAGCGGVWQPSNETWEWDGTNWQQMPAAPPGNARGAHGMAFDARRGRTVLFGGLRTDCGLQQNYVLNDTWTWDGTTWSSASPANSPSVRYSHGMAYDSSRGVVVLFGGEGTGGSSLLLRDVWEWDGTNWTATSSPTAPLGRMYHAMAFDEARGETVVFGGHSSTAFGDTWAYGIMPAVFDTHGSSCAGGLLLSPRLSGTPPWSGEVFRLDLTSLPLGISLPWLDSDLLPSALPLPPNCSLYVLPSLFLPVVLHPASFSASTSFLMPADQALIGSRFAGQAASVAVPAGTMGLTNAGVGRIQSRR